MRKVLSFIFICSFSAFLSAEAVPACNDRTSYECYRENIKNFCDAPEFEWNKKSNLGIATLPYAKIDEVGTTIDQLSKTESIKEIQEKIRNDIQALKQKSYRGFSILEVARLQYRTTMDNIFACSVVASRYEKIIKLEETLDKKYPPSKTSEIKRKLEKEKKKYERLKNQMRCQLNTEKEGKEKILDKLSNSAMKEYCHFTFYLTYIEDNLRENMKNIEKAENSLKEKDKERIARTTEDALDNMMRKSIEIRKEIERARDTLPKALVAYREMERTYSIHLLLVIIYDDYLTLRNHLSSYLSAISQLYEKAFNAQDANRR